MRRGQAKRIVLGVLAAGMLSISAFATSYGASAKMTITAGNGWQTNLQVKDKKAYANESTGKINVIKKTMITSPQAKIINSSKSTRSEITTLRGLGTYSVGLVSCQKGYTYYLSAKPSSAQTGTDYLTARINVG